MVRQIANRVCAGQHEELPELDRGRRCHPDCVGLTEVELDNILEEVDRVSLFAVRIPREPHHGVTGLSIVVLDAVDPSARYKVLELAASVGGQGWHCGELALKLDERSGIHATTTVAEVM